MRAALYLRVSTASQARDDRHSLPAQQEDSRAWCEERGLTVVAEYQDADSGTRQTREQFQQMFTDARKGAFEVVVVRSFSRFARDEWGAMARLGELMALGLEVHEYGEGNVIRKDDPMAFMGSSFKAYSTSAQAKEIKRDARRGQTAAISKSVFMGKPPFGYRKVGTTVEVDEAEAVTVRRIFDWCLKNVSILDTAKRLNAEGITQRSGKPWEAKRIRDVLINRAYTGVGTWGADTQILPVLIPEETWDAAAEVRARKNNLPPNVHKSPYLLSGIIRCECGAAMVGNTKRYRDRRIRYYVCTAHKNGLPCKNGRYWPADELEQEVLDELQRERGDAGTIRKEATEAVGELVARLQRLHRQKEAIESRKQKAVRDYMRGTNDENVYQLVQEVAAEELATVGDEIARTEQELVGARKRAADAHLLPAKAKDLASAFVDMPVSEAKAVLQSMVLRVVCYPAERSPVLYL